eukprot:m51a1_g2082 hypothetical protein (72) ;mRNA; r:1506940-1507155
MVESKVFGDQPDWRAELDMLEERNKKELAEACIAAREFVEKANTDPAPPTFTKSRRTTSAAMDTAHDVTFD